ncbi:peptidylprolyl isomerase [Sphingomonas bacterium]|uniref:peptidylprolyl isomerase n=1 Tax=Sphingomonas bacterium TaxID=1895847 RepID=UPI0015758719|nr:peptidylprolyl isomerase [Sphingomonas bacterium]
MFRKSIALGLGAFAALPLLAQATGPQGLAEPKPLSSDTPAPIAPRADPANIINIELSSGGTVSVLVRPDKAPKAVERLQTLAARHFYDGLTFHRVIDGFMAQGGDPKGTGEGESELPDLPDEINDLPHFRGAMAMARTSAPNSGNSQFYLMLSPNLALDRGYTVVGRVIQGMANVDHIARGEPPPAPTRMVRVYFGAPPADPGLPAPSVGSLPSAPIVLPPKPTAPASAPAKKPVRR